MARLLRDPEIARKLRDSRDADALYAVLAMPVDEQRGVAAVVIIRERG